MQFSSLGADEYVPELNEQVEQRMAAKMRRSDGQVRAVSGFLGLPVRATKWFIDPPEGAGVAEREAADLLREDLFRKKSHKTGV